MIFNFEVLILAFSYDPCPLSHQVLRFCGPLVPVYTAVTLLLACGGQLWSIARTGKPMEASQAVGRGLQPHKVDLPVFLLYLLLGYESVCASTPTSGVHTSNGDTQLEGVCSFYVPVDSTCDSPLPVPWWII